MKAAFIAFIIMSLINTDSVPALSSDRTGTEFLFIVNMSNPLPEDYSVSPDGLADVKHTRNDGRRVQKLHPSAAAALEELFEYAESSGIDISSPHGLSVTSGYRSFPEQKYIFDNGIRSLTDAGASYEDAYKKTVRIIMPPGCSEHQSGLAVDMHTLPFASVRFADTPEYLWLTENAHRFGFILRYPDDKEDITGVSFEPWHFRYVGAYHAKIIYEKKLCLEEYINLIK